MSIRRVSSVTTNRKRLAEPIQAQLGRKIALSDKCSDLTYAGTVNSSQPSSAPKYFQWVKLKLIK